MGIHHDEEDYERTYGTIVRKYHQTPLTKIAKARQVVHKAKDTIAISLKLTAMYQNRKHQEPDPDPWYAFILLESGGYVVPSIMEQQLAV